MSPLKYFVTAVAWSEDAFSAAQTLLNDHRNIIGILQTAVCLYDPLAFPCLHVATSHFNHEGDTTIYIVYSI